MRRLRLSLRYKFVLTLAGFTLLVAVPLGMLSITRFADELESQRRVEWETKAKTWDEQLSRELKGGFNLVDSCNWWFYKSSWSAEVIYMRVALLSDRVNLSCTVYNDLSPEARAHFLESAQETQPDPPDQIVRFSRGKDFLDLTYSTWIQVPMNLTQSVTVPTYVRLGIDLTGVQAQVRREATMIALVVVGYVVLGLLIAFVFYKMILGPAESLAAALKRFKRDPSTRVQVHSGDELETLAQEFNKMADAIEERNAELVKANRAKSDFLAVMSHELKTPLHAIRGYSQLLLEGIDGSLTEAQREDLQNILNAGNHLLELIDNILRFSKLEARGDQPYFEAVETAQVSEEAVKSMSALAREKGLSLEWSVSPCTLLADATKLKQALINLLSNAIKYTPAGRVSLTGLTRGGEYVFAVADTGVGIPEQERARIFEPFTQLDSSNTRESQGVGLGLAIVKKYIEMHGGRVWVESEVGRGSVFSVALPLTIPISEEVSHAHPDR